MKLNLLPYAVEALGYNEKIYEDLDRLYQARRYEFYRAAREHELYTHQIVTEGGLLQEEYCKKALGILLVATDEESGSEINGALSAIFRKGWTYAYLYVENNAEIDIGRFVERIVRKAGGIEKVSDDWINTNLFMVVFLAMNTGKEIIENDWYRKFMEISFGRWQHYKADEPTRISLQNASEENLAKVRDLKNKIYARYGHVVDYNGMYQKFARRSETMAFLFDFEQLSFPSIIEHVKFSERNIEEILLAFSVRNNPDDINAAAVFLCDAMHVRFMARAYKDVKKHYFENNRETVYVELEGLEKELSSARQEIVRLSGLLAAAQEETKKLERDLSRQRSELAEEKKNRQELNSLREFLFSLDQREEYKVGATYDLAELKNFKAVLIGGHEKWQQRMKELLPKFIFIHPDNIAFDLRLLDGVDTVFIYTQYLSHSIYERAMGAIAGRNIKIGFLNQPNEERALREIAKYFNTD